MLCITQELQDMEMCIVSSRLCTFQSYNLTHFALISQTLKADMTDL